MDSSVEVRVAGQRSIFSVLPLEETLSYFKHRGSEQPRLAGEYRSILMQLEMQVERFGKRIKMKFTESDRIQALHFKQLTCEMMVKDKGEMFCNHCNGMIPANDIIYERFARGKQKDRVSRGRRFYCRDGHKIFEFPDMKI